MSVRTLEATTKHPVSAALLLAALGAFTACGADVQGSPGEAAGVTSEAVTSLSWGSRGINVPGDQAHVSDLQQLGANAVRVNWHGLNTGTTWSYKNAGMRVLMVLDGNVGSGYDPAGFAQNAANIARSYGGSVDAYEVWNEENNNSLPATQYASLLNAACPAIHAANGNAAVVMGGLVGADNNYVNAVKQAMGSGWSCVNAVAFHLYEDDVNGHCTTYTASDLSMRTYRMAVTAGKPVLLTEWGSRGDPQELCPQSNIVAFSQSVGQTGLASAFYFTWRYSSSETFNGIPISEEVSLVNSNWTHKNSWKVWQQHVR